jgi:hypothetical protein
MQRAPILRGAILAVGVTIAGRPAQAQTTVGADLGLFSSYVWRGLSLTNKPVLQPDLYVTVPAGHAAFSAGAWSSIDVGRYGDFGNDLSESGGTAGFNLAELDLWGEVSYPVGKLTLTGGVLGYVFPNQAGFTKANNTLEIYGKAALTGPLSPKLAVYYDVDKIKGAYFEGAVSYSVAASQTVAVNLGALAGFNAGEAVPSDPGEFFNYADDGFTHLDLSAGVPLIAGSLAITPVVHFVVGGDDLVKITSPANSSDVKLWGGVSLAWSRALTRSPAADNTATP